MECAKYWRLHSLDIMDKLVDVYQKINITDEQVKGFYNVNFDKVLQYIGKFYSNESEDNIYLSSYSIAYNKIINIANSNNNSKKRFKYWVSKNQIKSLRRAYKQIYNAHKLGHTRFFVKVPYNTIDILNAVYQLAKNVDTAANLLNGHKVSDFLAKNYIELYRTEWMRNPELEQIERAKDLYDNILDNNQCANRIFKG